jgi:hypothetical protein
MTVSGTLCFLEDVETLMCFLEDVETLNNTTNTDILMTALDKYTDIYLTGLKMIPSLRC